MKLSQLSLADYNQLDSIPVINQDLSATDFTPVANTYYRHTGTTTNTFTQGVIYCYDGTEYKALDGSGGGGTTFNQYFYDLPCSKSSINMSRLIKIIKNAKGKVGICMAGSDPGTSLAYSMNVNSYWLFTGSSIDYSSSQNIITYVTILCNSSTEEVVSMYSTMLNVTLSEQMTVTKTNIVGKNALIRVIYYNDTEIT